MRPNGDNAFSMRRQGCWSEFRAFIARMGGLTAEGSGHITAALEDVTDAREPTQLCSSRRKYSIKRMDEAS